MSIEKLCLACMNDMESEQTCKLCGSPKKFISDPPQSLPLQSILKGKYYIGKAIGHGGFGITYIAWDLENNTRIAIKEYLPDGLVTRIPGSTMVSLYTGEKRDNFRYGLDKFLEEARVIYKFNSHKNIISVSDLFEENGTAYYVMEYIDGMDLKQYVESKGGRLSFEEVNSVLLPPVFDALYTIHQSKIIHRDISPDNIYITKDRQIKLLDFGAARYAVGEKSQNLSVILKLGYAPEEQCRSKGIQGPWTDIYALAATVYKLITGQVPPESAQRVVEDTIVYPSSLGAVIPAYAENALMKALAVRARDRYQSIPEFRDAITGVSRTNNTVDKPANTPIPGRDRGPAIRQPATEVHQNAAPVYAGFWERFAASFLDGLIIMPMNFIISGLVVYILEDSSYFSFYVFSTLISWLYYALLESSSKQSTVGKMALGIKVTGLNGNRLTFAKATGRYFGKIVSGLIMGIGFIMAGFTEKKQALHDIMAGTLVVKKEARLNVPLYNSGGYSGGFNTGSQSNAAVEQRHIPGRPALLCRKGIFSGAVFPIDSSILKIGRNFNSCQIVFPMDAPGISSEHCSVSFDNTKNAFVLRDLGSSCGTFLSNGQRISSGDIIILQEGSQFFLGNRETVFEVGFGN